MFRSIPRLAFVPLALALAACQGSIGDPSPDGANDGDGAETARRSAPEPLHRLNRLEYDNTVRDLLGVSITPARDFPPDASTDGFDNIAAGLALSPSQVDLYYTAAKALTRAALQDVPRFTQRVDARPYATTTAQPGTSFDWGWSLTRQGSKALELGSMTVPQDEAVTISVLAGGDHSATIPVPEMTLAIDGVAAQAWTVTASPTAPSVYSFQTTLPAGSHTFTVIFTNGYDQPAENVYNTLVVGYVDVTSDLRVTPPGRAMVYVCDPAKSTDAAGCYRKIITTFLERAWRRPVTAAEVAAPFETWKSVAESEGNDDVALELVLRGILVSSQFLYRASLRSVDVGGGFDGSEGLVPLDDHVLASRLSYFLWSSMPDDALFEAAKKGELRTDDGLRAQIDRMLADPKAKALEKGFAAQWLDTRRLAIATPNPDVFPEFDEQLRADMIAEAELFFAEFVKNDKPIAEMLTPDFGILTDRLATHYALPLPGKTTPVRVPLGPTQRRGLLSQGAWLTATSASTRTSPVNRGRWILEQLLCMPVPPPPPDVPAFKEPEPGASVRETLQQHRADPACASCHNLLDPAGLGMEELDGIGRLRTTENGKPIDTSGGIPSGETFVGSAELATLLARDRRVPECVTEKLMTYALGRQLDGDDEVFLSDIADALPIAGDSLHAAIELIVLSPAFRMRDAKEAE